MRSPICEVTAGKDAIKYGVLTAHLLLTSAVKLPYVKLTEVDLILVQFLLFINHIE
jgi:hypothetical protein